MVPPPESLLAFSVNEYSHFQLGNLKAINSHSGTGSALSVAANRISYFYNFHGPSVAIDTACSSSLASVHLACQSLRNQECHLAIAGGANIILSPAHSVAFTKAGVLAHDGKCKPFDARADGYVRSEGGGLVVLKHLSSALEDGDHILAVIPGSAIAQDGRTNGLMAPSQESQENLLKKAYQAAGVPPGSVQYVETHGTGTLLGDLMEASAIGEIIGKEKSPKSCAIGSVKSNIGHLEAAAGIAGLIKVILSIQHRSLPPSLHFSTPNPHIPFEKLNIYVQSELSSWPMPSAPAVAGVSSFGFGGTNVHVVLQAPESYPKNLIEDKAETQTPDFHFLSLSGNSQEGLKALADHFLEILTSDFELSITDICYAARVRRSMYNERLVAVGNSRMQLSQSLQAFVNGNAHPGLYLGNVLSGLLPKIAFIFSGQGGQWLEMGKRLLNRERIFTQIIDQIDQIILNEFHWSLKFFFLKPYKTNKDEVL